MIFSVNSKTWKQPKCTSMGDWLSKSCTLLGGSHNKWMAVSSQLMCPGTQHRQLLLPTVGSRALPASWVATPWPLPLGESRQTPSGRVRSGLSSAQAPQWLPSHSVQSQRLNWPQGLMICPRVPDFICRPPPSSAPATRTLECSFP